MCLFLCVSGGLFGQTRRIRNHVQLPHCQAVQKSPLPPKRTLYLCLKGRIWAAQAEAQGTSLHFMLASVFMCSQVVLLVSSQSGSCRVPRAPGTKTLWRVLSLLWRQNREQTFQTLLIFPHCSSLAVGSPSRLLSLFCRLPLNFLSLSLPLRLFLFYPLAASEQTCVEQCPQIPGSGPDQTELGAAEEADPGEDRTPAQGGGTCAWRRWKEGDWPTPFPFNPTCTQGHPSALPFFFPFSSYLPDIFTLLWHCSSNKDDCLITDVNTPEVFNSKRTMSGGKKRWCKNARLLYG